MGDIRSGTLGAQYGASGARHGPLGGGGPDSSVFKREAVLPFGGAEM